MIGQLMTLTLVSARALVEDGAKTSEGFDYLKEFHGSTAEDSHQSGKMAPFNVADDLDTAADIRGATDKKRDVDKDGMNDAKKIDVLTAKVAKLEAALRDMNHRRKAEAQDEEEDEHEENE